MKTCILAGLLVLTAGTASNAAPGQSFWDQALPERPDRDKPYWGQRWDEGDDWGYGNGYGPRASIVRSGGERPVIEPKAPEKIAFTANFAPNTIVIDTAARKLYYILSSNEAYRYPISVGRQGFSWTGTQVISRKQQWPDWYPPQEMIARDPRLPDKMTGGLHNPLGALALYLGNTLYRVHGTNDVSSIGRAASSGCFRMRNEHVEHLASIAPIGTPVIVVKSLLRVPPMAHNTPPTVIARAQAPAEPPVALEHLGWNEEEGRSGPARGDGSETPGARLSNGAWLTLHAF